MTKRVFLFLGLTLSITWIVEFIALQNFGSFDAINQVGGAQVNMIFVLVACMFIPTLVVLFIKRVLFKENLSGLGLGFNINYWWLAGIAIPLFIALASIPVSTLQPGVSLADGQGFILDQLQSANLSDEDLAKAQESLSASALKGWWLAFFLFGVGVLAGATVNAIAAFGEEFAWRSYLQSELAHYGFWKSCLWIGLVWGIWHFPIVYGGYNYPGAPVAGMLMMTVFTALWSPLHAFVRVMGRSVYPAAIMHGVINAIGATTYIFLENGSRFSSGIMGWPGVVLAVLACVLVYFFQRCFAETWNEAWAAFLAAAPRIGAV